MIGMFRAEFLKLFKRLPYWVMLLVLVFFVGVTAVLVIVLPRVAPDTFGEIPEIGRPELFVLGIQTAVGQTWFPAILAAVMVGGEVGSSIWPSSLTLESRRWLHLLVKLATITLGALLAVVVALMLWVALVFLFVDGTGGPEPSEWLGLVWKSTVIQLTWVALGIGAVGLFKSIGPAIGAVIGLNLGEGLLSLWRPWQNVSISANQTAVLGEVAEFGGAFGPSGPDISAGRATIVVLGWALIALSAAIVGLTIRDP